MENKRNYIYVGIISILLCFIAKQYIYYLEVKNNKKSTLGKIIKYEETNRDYTLYYEYIVDGKLYTGKTSVAYFEDLRKGKFCVGCNFKVYYSSKNPDKSSIYLSQYEKNKRTVEFFDLE